MVLLLAVLLAAVTVSIFLDAPNARAFPQYNSEDQWLFVPGSGDIAVVDINRDGYLDFIVSERATPNDKGTFTVCVRNPPVNQYACAETVGAPRHKRILVDDFDGDEWPDVLVLDDTMSSSIFFYRHRPTPDGPYYPQFPNLALYALGAIDMAVGPLLTAGHDIAVVYPDNVTVLRFIGWPWYYDTQRSVVLNDSAGYQRAVVSDVDGNGRLDLLLAKPDAIRVYYNLGTQIDPSCDANCTTYPVPGGLNGNVSVAISDVTSDGLDDIVMAVSNRSALRGTVVILAQEGTLWDFTEIFRDERDLTDQLALADLNGDGATDVAIILYIGNVAVFYQQAGGVFENRVGLQLVSGGSGANKTIAHGDFNDDGIQDIALRLPDEVLLFYQEDSPVTFYPLIQSQCPKSCSYFNQDSFGDNLIDLSDYFHDDHGPITYSIAYQEQRDNLSAVLDADGHHLDFVPKPGWSGQARFRVEANDAYSRHLPTSSNEFSVMVNGIPAITSAPSSQVTLGQEYTYLPVVSDPYPLQDFHTFSLLESPQGVAFDETSGLVRWRPTAVGKYAISLRVEDSYGGVSSVQTFVVAVLAAPEQPPNQPLIPIPIPKDLGGILILAALLGTLFALSAAIVINENLKYGTLLLLLPLYSKIKREKVLDHFIRGQIFGYVMANPGEHYNSIKQALDITNGSLAHHLKTLEREHFIKSKRFGLYRRFYPWSMRVPEDGYFRLNEIQKNMLDLCRHQPGVTQKEIAASLNLTPPTINYHIAILAEHGYVSVVRKGRKTHVYVLKAAA